MLSTHTESSRSDGHAPMDANTDSSADEGPGGGRDEGALPPGKLACQRCRRRKIKCDRIHPCAHCIKARSECLYESTQKARAKRQRGLISSVYENKMEHISKKIDDLTEMITRLDPRHLENADSPAPDPWPTGLRPQPASYTAAAATVRPPDKRRSLSLSEHEFIDSSLFAHAAMATKFLQDTVHTDTSISNAATEMTSVLDILRPVVDSQRRQNNTPDQLHPFSKPLLPGTCLSDLAIPPLANIMACLRVAREHPRVLVFWPCESSALGDFTEYVIKVCSPGPVMDADLIIVHSGLYWLFWECSGIMTEDELKQDFQAQALVCMQSLETVLSNLSFHVPMNIDYVYALYMAALYSFQRNKPSVAWEFICKVSLIAQGLGLHSKLSMAGETSEDRRRKSYLFWRIYALEKALSLRLVRASTIRDHDVTIPKPEAERRPVSVLQSRSINWIDEAGFYGRLYDDLFSPSSLTLPMPTRLALARALASDWEHIFVKREEYYKQLEQEPCGTAEPVLLAFLKHADRVSAYSLLTAIHRCIPVDGSTGAGISGECLSMARVAIDEHIKCISMLPNEALISIHLDLWINGTLLLLPLIPFNILFCNTVETGDNSDLGYLKGLVAAIEALSEIPRYSCCTRLLRIFGPLFNVASKYVEVKAKALGLNGIAVSQTVHLDGTMAATHDGVQDKRLVENIPPPGNYQNRIGVFEDQRFNDFEMELDPLGIEMGSWLQENNEMMNFLLGSRVVDRPMDGGTETK